jgi:hypothetical protein
VSALGVVGVLLVAAGVLLVASSGRFWVQETQNVTLLRRDVRLGLAVGVTIAGYTLVDSEGLEHAHPLVSSSSASAADWGSAR